MAIAVRVFWVCRGGRAAAGEALAAMLELVAAGSWQLPYEPVDLEQLGDVWSELEVAGSGRRIVALPGGGAR
jgi:hypothetical protein